MSIKRFTALALALALCAGMMTGCGKGSKSEASSKAEPQATATPAPTPTPEPYHANVLTGEPVSGDYIPERITGIMVNNLTAARPQRGLSDADMLFEIKVEGGITRFMPVYSNYQVISEIGPIRSGRDQFFRLILPFQALYIHEGQSVVQAQYVQDYDYSDWNINNGANGYRDYNRVNWQGRSHSNGLATEHTMYTSGENIAQYLQKNDVDMAKDYSSTYFNFVDYRSENPVREINGEDAQLVTITHSASYKTRFIYDASTKTYKMQQYYSTDNKWRDSVDENNGVTLTFTNLVVMYTDIHTYPGHEAKDLQYADYDFGGVGFYFYGGKCERIWWQKGTPLEALRLYYNDSNGQCSDEMVEVNIGKSYVTMVDLDEYEKGFSYGSTEGTDLSSAGKGSYTPSAKEEVEVGEDDTAAPAPAAEAAPAEETPAEETSEETPAEEAPAEEAPAEEPAPENTEEASENTEGGENTEG